MTIQKNARYMHKQFVFNYFCTSIKQTKTVMFTIILLFIFNEHN